MEVCKICGQSVDVLTEYHVSKHGLTKEEYRQKYGDNKIKHIRIPKLKLTEIEKYEASKFVNSRSY